jgi:hypothetical protein
MANITSANSTLMLGVNGLFGTAQAMEGFGSDDAYSIDVVEVTESVMGVDGKMSTGWIPQIKTMHINLQADSPLNLFFETWYAAQESARNPLFAFGVVTQDSVGKVYTMVNGVLNGYTPLADAKKVLSPRKFTIKWEQVLPSQI